MPVYEGTAIKDKAVIRKSPATGMKIGALKAGNAVTGDKLEVGSDGNKWMRIQKPLAGWVLILDLNFTDPEADSPAVTQVDTPAAEPKTTSAVNQPVTNTPSTNPSGAAGDLYKVKIWGDPIMVKQGFEVVEAGSTNFQAVKLFIEDGSCGGVTSFLRIQRDDINKLKSLQVADNYNAKQKMEWLCSHRGSIYMYENEDDSWETAPSMRWGTISLGGNLVMVDAIVDMVAKPPDGIRRELKMARLVSFRKTDWGKTWKTHPHLVHRAYCAYKNNQFGDSPKGIIYTPLFSPLDWDFAGTQQPKAFYLPLEWLEKQA